ncbi:MAG: DNA replication/repair protein RecF [Pseudomonadota bacterium]
MARTILTTLDLSLFRSHRQARLQLSGAPVALFGPNGAGKTNILEAISMLSPGRGLRRAAAEDLARSPEAQGWRVAATLQGQGRVHSLETRAELGARRSVEIDGKAAPQAALGRLLRMVWLVPVMDRLWVEGAAERRRFLDRVALSFEPAHGDVVLAYDKAMRERNRLLKDGVTDGAWYTALEVQMAQNGAEVIQNRRAALSRLVPAQAGGAFPKAEMAILPGDETPEDADEEALRTALGEARRRDLAAGRTLVGPHRADLLAIYSAKGIEARLCSTGEQKALLVSLILANATALAQELGTPPVLLLDEVGAHLDAARREALFDAICALGAQAFMTGTGPELFTALSDRAEWFEITEKGGESQVRGVDPQ